MKHLSTEVYYRMHPGCSHFNYMKETLIVYVLPYIIYNITVILYGSRLYS